MARSSSSGGGGRSSSSGSSHSSSSRGSSGGYRSGSSSSRGNSGFGWGSGFGGNSSNHKSSGFNINSGYNRTFIFGGNLFRGRNTSARNNSSGGSARGSARGIINLLFIIVILIVLGYFFLSVDNGIPRNTVERTALTSIAPGDVLIYKDATSSGGWFSGSVSEMESGANEAHRLTGVKFGVYVIDGNHTDEALEELADRVYGEWFGDSGSHMLIVLADLGNGEFAAMDMIGDQAGTIFDNEAMKIFYGYLARYWKDNFNEYKMFGRALSDSANRIMHITPTFGSRMAPFLGVSAVILVIFVGLTFALKASAKRKMAEAEKAKASAELLNTKIEGLDTTEDDPLLDKYSQEGQSE